MPQAIGSVSQATVKEAGDARQKCRSLILRGEEGARDKFPFFDPDRLSQDPVSPYSPSRDILQG